MRLFNKDLYEVGKPNLKTKTCLNNQPAHSRLLLNFYFIKKRKIERVETTGAVNY